MVDIFAQDPIGRAELREIKKKLQTQVELAMNLPPHLRDAGAVTMIVLCARLVSTLEHERDDFVPYTHELDCGCPRPGPHKFSCRFSGQEANRAGGSDGP